MGNSERKCSVRVMRPANDPDEDGRMNRTHEVELISVAELFAEIRHRKKTA